MKNKRGRPSKILNDAKITEMRKLGASCKKIGDSFGVSETVIRKSLIKTNSLNIHKELFNKLSISE